MNTNKTINSQKSINSENTEKDTEKSCNQTHSQREISLAVEELICNPHKIAVYLKNKEWEILYQVVNTLNSKLPKDLPQTDPARFRKFMRGITECYILGWHRLNTANLNKLRKNK
jgi:hypothetical protein